MHSSAAFRGTSLVQTIGRMHASFCKNGFNRIEESYGNVKNLCGR